MKRTASFEAFFPDIDLSQDYQVRFSSQDPKRYRQSSEEPTFFSVSFSKKVQADNLVPTLLAVNGPDKCLLEVADETSRQLVCEGSLEEGEAECFMYFDPETNEFIITELEENYVFGEAHDPNITQFEDADLMAALVPSPKAPNGFIAQSASNHSLVSPRPSNGSNSSKAQAPRVNGVSRVPAPAPKVPSPKPISRTASREESAPRPSRPEPVPEKAPVRKTSPVAPAVVPLKAAPVKPVVVAKPPSPKPAPAKPATPKPVTPKLDSPKAIDDEFDLMDMIGQDADSEPEKITEDNLFGFDEDDFQEVKTDSESEPETKPVPKIQVAKQASPKRLPQRKKAPAKKAALSSSSGSSSSSSGSSSSGSSSSSSGSGSSSSGSDSSSDSDSDSDSNKKKVKKPLKQAPVSKPIPAKKTPSPAQASTFAEEDMFAFDENDYDKTDIFDFGPSGHADSDDEFKATSNSITNADLPTTDEDEPVPKTIPPPKEDLNSSDYSSDNDQRYAKVDLAFIDDDQFDIV